MILFTALAGSAHGASQDSGRSLQLQGQIEIVRLVDLSAELLNLSIQYDPTQLRGSVFVRLQGGVTDGELWALTNRLLSSQGFTTIRMPGESTLSVVRLQEAGSLAELEWESGDDLRPGFVARAVRLSWLPSVVAIEALKPLLSKTGASVESLGERGPIVIRDLTPRVDAILAYIASLDQADVPPVTRIIEVRNLKATSLAATVMATISSRNAMTRQTVRGKLTATPDDRSIVLVCPTDEIETWLSLIDQFDQQEAVTTETYSVPSFAIDSIADLIDQSIDREAPGGSGIRWRLVRDALTFTLTVTASFGEHEQIASILERLNSIPEADRRPIRTFVIRNRSVADVLGVLEQLIQAGAAGVSAPGTARRSAAERQTAPAANPYSSGVPAASNAARPADSASIGTSVETGITLTADAGTNRIIAIGDVAVMNQIAALIEQIDIRQPQVMVEVTVASLTEGDTFDLGVELNHIEMNGGTVIDLASLFGLGSGGNPSTIPAGGSGFNGVVLSPGDYSVIVRALKTVNEGRAVNLPRMLVNNNQEAVLNSVQQEPFLATNASDTVATTSFGGTQDAGTTITVTPQISEADHLILDYSVAVSTFTGESSDPSLPPPRQQNTLQSTVTVPDGYTLVVGGLTVTNVAEAVSQVPLLGDIPLLGELFKNRSQSDSTTRFVIFIRCSIMRHDNFEDLMFVSEPVRREMGITDGWPEVTPRIIR
jgi:type II secretory pathway component GspD/PulD (secretin)